MREGPLASPDVKLRLTTDELRDIGDAVDEGGRGAEYEDTDESDPEERERTLRRFCLILAAQYRKVHLDSVSEFKYTTPLEEEPAPIIHRRRPG